MASWRPRWRSIKSAPRTGERIIIFGDVASAGPENAFNGPVTARWDEDAQDFMLSPQPIVGEWDAQVDNRVEWWMPLPDAEDDGKPLASAPRRWWASILVRARVTGLVKEQDFHDWVIVHWQSEDADWRLLPYIEGSKFQRITSGWFGLPPYEPPEMLKEDWLVQV